MCPPGWWVMVWLKRKSDHPPCTGRKMPNGSVGKVIVPLDSVATGLKSSRVGSWSDWIFPAKGTTTPWFFRSSKFIVFALRKRGTGKWVLRTPVRRRWRRRKIMWAGKNALLLAFNYVWKVQGFTFVYQVGLKIYWSVELRSFRALVCLSVDKFVED